MAVKIRLSRLGRLHKPYYRVVVIDGRNAREGLSIEVVGSYDPALKEKQLQVDLEKVKTWIASGAQVSAGLTTLLKHYGYIVPAKPKAKREKAPAKDGKKFVPATRRAKRKHAAKLKAERKAAAATAAAAPAAAAPAADAPAAT